MASFQDIGSGFRRSFATRRAFVKAGKGWFRARRWAKFNILGGKVSEFTCTVKVRYAETDQMKVLHHSLWPVYWEVARGAFMESLGFPYGELEKNQGIYFPVISVGAEIQSPAYYDDEIELRCQVAELGRVKLRFHYEGWRGDTLLARGHSQHGVIDLNWKVVKLPEEVREALKTVKEN